MYLINIYITCLWMKLKKGKGVLIWVKRVDRVYWAMGELIYNFVWRKLIYILLWLQRPLCSFSTFLLSLKFVSLISRPFSLRLNKMKVEFTVLYPFFSKKQKGVSILENLYNITLIHFILPSLSILFLSPFKPINCEKPGLKVKKKESRGWLFNTMSGVSLSFSYHEHICLNKRTWYVCCWE